MSRKRIEQFALEHADAAGELRAWFSVAKRADWQGLTDVRQHFSDADQVGKMLVFNIRHNTYRLIVKVDYRSHLLMVKELLSHNRYAKGMWKQ